MGDEFRAYGVYSDLMERLVDKDENVEEFYSLATDHILKTYPGQPQKVRVFYQDGDYDGERKLIKGGIDYVLGKGNPNEGIEIIITNIRLIHQDNKDISSHSIFVIKDKKVTYFFDPNGYYSSESNNWLYNVDGVTFSNTTNFKKQYKLVTPKSSKKKPIPGIQYIPIHIDTQKMVEDDDADKTQYIGGGGYCMFYNLFAVIYIIDKIYEGNSLENIYNSISYPERFLNVFPPSGSIKNNLNGTTHTLDDLTIEKFSYQKIVELHEKLNK